MAFLAFLQLQLLQTLHLRKSFHRQRSAEAHVSRKRQFDSPEAMGPYPSKQTQTAEKPIEADTSSGSHFIEIHAPTAGVSVFTIILIVVVAACAWAFVRRRRYRDSRRWPHSHWPHDPYSLPQPYPWGTPPWPAHPPAYPPPQYPPPPYYTNRIRALDEEDEHPPVPAAQRAPPRALPRGPAAVPLAAALRDPGAAEV